MKIITFILAAIVCVTQAQTSIQKSIPVRTGQAIKMNFDYPELVKVTTWDRNEVLIEGSVTINNGENDDAFELHVDNEGSYISIANVIRDMKNLPQVVTVLKDGKKTIFRSKADYEKHKEQFGGGYNVKSWGVDMVEGDLAQPG